MGSDLSINDKNAL